MATRRHVTSGRGVYTYPKNEFDCHRNNSCVLESTRGPGRCSNGYRCSSGGAGDVSRCGQVRGQSRLADGVSVDETKNGKSGVCEVGQEKKRKFSSIICEKEARISSKNMIVMCRQSESPLTTDKPLECGSVDSTITDCSETSSSLVQDICGRDGQERDQLEDGEYVQTRDILMSRWASESDSPTYVFEGEEKKEMTLHRDVSRTLFEPLSSPECGEILREASEEYRSIRSKSIDGLQSPAASREVYSDNDLINEDVMEIEKNHNADIVIGQLDSPSDDDNDAHRTKDNTVPKRSINMLQSCRSVFDYEKVNKINEGTYGVVFRAKHKQTGEIVALKKVKLGLGKDGGFPLSFLREINILSSFQHPSIVNLKEVVMGDIDSVYVVMEYMEHDLKAVMDVMKYPFSSSEVKCLMLQLLGGVKYLHDNWVLHRDLKSSNLLFNNSGELKICDFGMSRQYGSSVKPYTPLVVTLWYRAPELLLGAKQYSTAIDMWSVGCIMAEMLSKEPLFQGKSEVEQLDKIFRTLGTPNEMIWPGLSKLPGASAKFYYQPNNQLRKKFPAASFTGSPILSESGFDLLSKLLAYDPEKRISAEAALDHDWFREDPLPKCKNFMPTFPAQNAQNRSRNR